MEDMPRKEKKCLEIERGRRNRKQSCKFGAEILVLMLGIGPGL